MGQQPLITCLWYLLINKLIDKIFQCSPVTVMILILNFWTGLLSQRRILLPTMLKLSNINLPSDAIRCSDVNCNDWKHREDISSLYTHVMRALYESSGLYFKQKNKRGNMIQ